MMKKMRKNKIEISCLCGHYKKDHEINLSFSSITHCDKCAIRECCHPLVQDNLKYLEERYEQSIK